MSSTASALVNKVWNYCNLLRDDGVSYGDYVEQLTYLLFLKMDYERTRPPYNRKSSIPQLLQELLKRQYPIRVLYTAGHWLDINSLEDVVQAGNF